MRDLITGGSDMRKFIGYTIIAIAYFGLGLMMVIALGMYGA